MLPLPKAKVEYFVSKPKYYEFTIKSDKKRQQTFTIKKLKQKNVWYFVLKMAELIDMSVFNKKFQIKHLTVNLYYHILIKILV